MSDSDEHGILKQARQALSESNARRFDGDDNFKKRLVITTAVVGPGHVNDAFGSGFVFEAKIPRSAVNDLALTYVWSASTRAEAAAFLRALADLIEETTEEVS
jgi:delta 1-pyrroline-5-carboxylate dehydrogenase